MKDELVRQVAEKTGLSEDLARTAVETVLDALKDRLPDPLAQSLDALLSGESTDMGDMLQKGLSNFFGG